MVFGLLYPPFKLKGDPTGRVFFRASGLRGAKRKCCVFPALLLLSARKPIVFHTKNSRGGVNPQKSPKGFNMHSPGCNPGKKGVHSIQP